MKGRRDRLIPFLLRMPTFWALPLRRQLFLAIPLLLVPVVGAAIWSVLETRRERMADLGAEAEAVGRTIAAYLARDAAIVDQAAAQIAATPELRAFDPAGLAELFARVDTRSETLAGFSLVRIDGTVVAAEGIAPEPPNDDWSGASAASSRRVVLAMRTSPGGGRLIPFVYPIPDESGRVVAALTVAAGVPRIQEVFGSIPDRKSV